MLCKGILNPSLLELLARIPHTHVRAGETAIRNLVLDSA